MGCTTLAVRQVLADITHADDIVLIVLVIGVSYENDTEIMKVSIHTDIHSLSRSNPVLFLVLAYVMLFTRYLFVQMTNILLGRILYF